MKLERVSDFKVGMLVIFNPNSKIDRRYSCRNCKLKVSRIEEYGVYFVKYGNESFHESCRLHDGASCHYRQFPAKVIYSPLMEEITGVLEVENI